jgi:predicted MFS family arabinose efflux permease
MVVKIAYIANLDNVVKDNPARGLLRPAEECPMSPAREAVNEPAAPRVAAWRTILAGLSASLVGIGLARFGYTPLIPPLIQAHWFAPGDVISLGAANLAGYLVGAILGRPVAARLGNAHALRAMMTAVALSFVACAFPLSVGWFFLWRFVSGVAGGTIMVLVAATLLPHVPQARRGLISGAIFLGLGLGIACSGTLVPLLLELGLRATWIGLALVCAAFTAASWFAWPGANAHPHGAPDTHGAQPGVPARVMAAFYAQYGLMAVGLVPAMVFLVDFVTRGLHAGTHMGALFWVLYGIGAIFGPPLYGLLGDRVGVRPALRVVLGLQALAVLGLYALQAPPALPSRPWSWAASRPASSRWCSPASMNSSRTAPPARTRPGAARRPSSPPRRPGPATRTRRCSARATATTGCCSWSPPWPSWRAWRPISSC